jgi:hypothetical protein
MVQKNTIEEEKMTESTGLIEEFTETHAYTYEVTMLVQILAPTREVADAKLDKEGGYISNRDVKFISSTPLFTPTSKEEKVEENIDDEKGWH